MVTIRSTSSSVNSPALLFMSMSAFFKTRLENLLPIPYTGDIPSSTYLAFTVHQGLRFTLIAVMPNMHFCFPSMFVFKTRRICVKLSGIIKLYRTKEQTSIKVTESASLSRLKTIEKTREPTIFSSTQRRTATIIKGIVSFSWFRPPDQTAPS